MSTHENPFASIEVMPPLDECWAARRRIAQQIQFLAEQLLTRETGLEALEKLEAQLCEAKQTLANGIERNGRTSWIGDGTRNGGYRVMSREITPIAGTINAIAPPLNMWLDTETKEAHGRVNCNWCYEGPPNCVHGGIVSAIFDDFLGAAQLITGQAGATGKLTLHYHKPTPLNTELQLVARVKSINGRKIIMEGEMYANDVLTVSAEGLFIAIREGVMKLSERQQNP
ncbi:MAG: PaaI family thioesterase [Pseudomonadales bacterium]|nr:PaaI family thioesterase [Pseudomonadales bacterium]